MIRVFIVVLLLHINHASSKENFKVKGGIYLNKDCFMKISKVDEFIKLQFAFRPQHNLELGYETMENFHPDNILGTNVIYDKINGSIEFGPGRCTGEKIHNIRSRARNRSWKIACGGSFKKSRVNLILYTDKSNRLIKFSYKEETNSRGYRLINWPWLKRPVYNFLCRGFKVLNLQS